MCIATQAEALPDSGVAERMSNLLHDDHENRRPDRYALLPRPYPSFGPAQNLVRRPKLSSFPPMKTLIR
jgi:hypothetical protein